MNPASHHLKENTSSDPMRDFVRSLASHRAPPPPDTAKAEKAEHWRLRMVPLKDRVKDKLSRIPAEVKAEGISIRALSEELSGKYRGAAAQREIASCLRSLGYVSRRQWTKRETTGAVMLWFPPATSTKETT